MMRWSYFVVTSGFIFVWKNQHHFAILSWCSCHSEGLTASNLSIKLNFKTAAREKNTTHWLQFNISTSLALFYFLHPLLFFTSSSAPPFSLSSQLRIERWASSLPAVTQHRSQISVLWSCARHDDIGDRCSPARCDRRVSSLPVAWTWLRLRLCVSLGWKVMKRRFQKWDREDVGRRQRGQKSEMRAEKIGEGRMEGAVDGEEEKGAGEKHGDYVELGTTTWVLESGPDTTDFAAEFLLCTVSCTQPTPRGDKLTIKATRIRIHIEVMTVCELF